MKLFRSKAFFALRGGGEAWQRSERITPTTRIRSICACFINDDFGAVLTTASSTRSAASRTFGTVPGTTAPSTPNHRPSSPHRASLLDIDVASNCRLDSPRRSFQTTSLVWAKKSITFPNDSYDDATTTTTTSSMSHPSEHEQQPNHNDATETADTDTTSSWINSLPGTRTSVSGRQLAIVFTCTVCDTRSAKQFTENAYQHGVVMVQCPGCNNWHLIADRLGYFNNVMEDDDDNDNTNGKGWDVTSLLAQRGKNGTTTMNDVMELTLEDLVGSEKLKEILEENAKSHSEEEGSSSEKTT